MKYLKRLVISVTLLIINFIFILSANETSAMASFTIDSFLATYGSGNSFVDSDGYIYWLTSGKTASSSSTTGFCTVGICVTYGNYTVEFAEPCSANKRIWYANGTPMYITVVEEKSISGITYDLLRIKKQDIIDAFLTKYSNVDFMGSLISNQNVHLIVNSIMTTWKKNGNYKDSQCGTLSANNYTISCSSGTICKNKISMMQYYKNTTGTINQFNDYYNIDVVMSNAGIAPKIKVDNPIALNETSKPHYYDKKNDVYWVKYGNTLTLKWETNVIDGGATYQPTIGALKTVKGANTAYDYIRLDRGATIAGSSTNMQHTVNAGYYPSKITTDNIMKKNGFQYIACGELRLGYNQLVTYIEIKPAKGQRPLFYGSGSVTNLNGTVLISGTSSKYLKVWADGTAPTPTINGYSSNWVRKDQVLTLTANDSESGVKDYYFSSNKSKTLTITKEGKTSVYYYTKDNVGNSTSGRKIVKLDKTKPIITSDLDDDDDKFYNSNRVVNFHITDNLSGIKTITLFKVSFTGGTKKIKEITVPTEEQLSYDFSYDFTEDTNIQVTVTDYAGNTKSYLNNIRIDKEPPKVENVELEYGWVNSTVTINPIITDNLSGVESYKFYDENNNELSTNELSVSTDFRKIVLKAMRFSDEQDTKYRVEMTDKAGNSGSFEFSVKIDKTQPIINGTALVSENIYHFKGEDVYYIQDGLVDVISNDPKTKNNAFSNEISSGMAKLELYDENNVVYGVYSAENGGLLDAYNDIYSIIYNIDTNTERFWYLIATDRAGNMRKIMLVSNKKVIATYQTVIPIENYK